MNTWYKKMKRIVWVTPTSLIKSLLPPNKDLSDRALDIASLDKENKFIPGSLNRE